MRARGKRGIQAGGTKPIKVFKLRQLAASLREPCASTVGYDREVCSMDLLGDDPLAGRHRCPRLRGLGSSDILFTQRLPWRSSRSFVPGPDALVVIRLPQISLETALLLFTAETGVQPVCTHKLW